MQYLLKNLKSAFGIALLFAVGGLATMQTTFAEDTATKEKPAAKKTDKKAAAKKSAKKLTPEQEAAQKKQQEKIAKQKEINAMDPLAAPEGDTKKILEFISDIKTWQPEFKMPARPTPEELKDDEVKKKYQTEFMEARMTAIKKLREARHYLVTTIDKVLEATDLDEKDQLATIKTKIAVLNELVTNFADAKARTVLEKTMEKYRDHANPEIAGQAKTFFFVKKVQEFAKNKDDAPTAEIAKDGVELVKALGPHIDQSTVRQISSVGTFIESKEDYASAIELYGAILSAAQSEEVKKNLAISDAEYKQFIKGCQANLNRAGIPGKPANLSGKTITDEDFNITSYKGKVVLIDFWATWCGPCIGELPNVIENYKKYHDKGFEIVAVSLDVIDDKEKLEKFVKEKEIPWVQIQSRDENAQGWDDALVLQYGVRGIPATFLVDQSGVVIQTNVRGPKLGEALEKLLGPVEDKKDDEKKVDTNDAKKQLSKK